MTTRSLVTTGLVVALFAAAGCGDDDDSASGADNASASEAGTESGSDVAEYCDATLAIETVPEPEIDFEAMSPEEQAAVARDWASETLQPLAEDAAAVAPAELEDDVAVAVAAVEELGETGDFVGFGEDPETSAALERLHAFDLDNCGWNAVELTAKDYSFEGLPEELPSGLTSFELTNDGTEMHEIALLRKNEGVTESAEELLALPEEEALQKATFLGVAFAPPGSSEYQVADLEPGEYIALCFIPQGTVSEDTPPSPDAPPHFTLGMVHEFTVS